MKPRSIFLIVALLLLASLIACDIPTGTPTPTGPAKALNPIPNQAQFANSTNLPPPPALAACPPPGALINIHSFCANNGAQLGGASFSWQTDPAAPNGEAYHVYEDFTGSPDSVTCTGNDTCSGPQGAVATINVCGVCSSSSTWQTDLNSDPSVCPNGFGGPGCTPNGTLGKNYFPMFDCAPGSHYDNHLQNCANDVTGKLESPCPPAYPYLLSGGGFPSKCYKNPQPISYGCQSYKVPLGICPGAQHKQNVPGPNTGTNTCALAIAGP